MRAVHEATTGRQAKPTLLNGSGARMSPASAAGRLRRLTSDRAEHPISPHSLRRTFCTAGLVSGVVPLRDMQYGMRHSDSCTTLRYDMSRANLDRHTAHPIAADRCRHGRRIPAKRRRLSPWKSLALGCRHPGGYPALRVSRPMT